MSPPESLLILVILSSITVAETRHDKPKEPSRDMCQKDSYPVWGGTLSISGSLTYKVNCPEDFVVPWGFPNQSYTYTCRKGQLDQSVPRFCIPMIIAPRLINFTVNSIVSKNDKKLCKDKLTHSRLEENYNQAVREKFGVGHSGIISYCEQVNTTTASLVWLTTTFTTKANNTPEELRMAKANTVLVAFLLLKNMLEKYEYTILNMGRSDMYSGLEYQESDPSDDEYHCKWPLRLRIDNGIHVCVSCGKGWWLETATYICHPCGPGFYNDEYHAVKCNRCPIKYTRAPWAARSIDDCFDMDGVPEGEIRYIVESILVPTIYLSLVTILVIVLSKAANIRLNKQRQSKGPCGGGSSDAPVARTGSKVSGRS